MPDNKKRFPDPTGLVLSGDVKVYLIFWGAYWDSREADEDQIVEKVVKATAAMLADEEYLRSLKDEYRWPIVVLGGYRVDSRTEPPQGFINADVETEVFGWRRTGFVNPDGYSLYMVIMGKGAVPAASNQGIDPRPGVGGHWFNHDAQLYYGWVLSGRGRERVYQRITSSLSEEIIEAVTNPEHTGWVTQDSDGAYEELCDVCEAISYKLKPQVLVKTYYSNDADDCFPPLA